MADISRQGQLLDPTSYTQSQQAESGILNPLGGGAQLRILVELQLISVLLHEAMGSGDDLVQMRQDVASSLLPYFTRPA